MNDTWQLQDAKAKFSEVIEKAQNGEPQFITKRGEPAVVILSHREFIRQRQRSMSLREALSGAPEEIKTIRDKTPIKPMRLI